MHSVYTLRMYIFHLVVVDVGANQSTTVCTYPDVTLTVASNAVDTMVGVNTRHLQLVANGGIPSIGALIIKHKGSLTIEPDVILQVGIGIQCVRLAKMLLGDIIVLPYTMLLMHDITTNDTSIIVDNQCTIATFADS